MSLILNESLVLAKTRSQDLKSVLKLNCWGSGIKDVSLVRQLVNVEVIGLSSNEISSLEDFAYCPKLRELILRKNQIKNISEVAHLQNLPKLTSLWLGENPCAENTHNYRKVVLKALPNLTILDNIPVTKEELQEIEELGNEIYEEVAYESSHSSGSGHNSCPQQQQQQQPKAQPQQISATTPTNQTNTSIIEQQLQEQSISEQHNNQAETTFQNLHEQNINESSFFLPTTQTPQPARCLSLQGSVTALNGSGQTWSGSVNNNNNNNIHNNNNYNLTSSSILPKGGKSRNGNILSAVLCLIKELDYVSCEVVQTALHCRMEEFTQ